MKEVSRRRLLKAGAVTGGAAVIGVPQLLTRRTAAMSSVIDPSSIPKYVTPLFILPAMPPSGANKWSVAARRFTQQILPSGFPATTVFGMGSTTDPSTNHAPAYTIEAPVNELTQVTWVNQLVDSSGNFVPHLLPVDPTLHWANPPGRMNGRDSRPTFTSTPGPYTGPVPFTAHLHGSHDFEENDGYPESWFLPVANNIPKGYATVGSFYEQFRDEAHRHYGVTWQPGSATFSYENDQRATNLWFHDHSLGLTRLNASCGLTGHYILRGGPSDLPPGVLPGPAPRPGDPPGTKYYEIPLVFADHNFNTDGSIAWPATNQSSPGPYIPYTDIPPIWSDPGQTGGVMMVNGNSWPFLEVEPRRYRFRLLNTCNFRVLRLKVVSDPAIFGGRPALPIWVIGSDGGFLPAPVMLDSSNPANDLQILQSERYDVIIDFTDVPVGTKLYLVDEVGPVQADDNALPNEVMQFQVVPRTSVDTSTPPDQLNLPGFKKLPDATNLRRVSFNMIMSAFQPSVVAKHLCGTVDANGKTTPLMWHDPITEAPVVNTTEDWEVWNFAAGGHDFHIHLVEFQIQDRRKISDGSNLPLAPYESGDKDSAFAPTGTITRIRATFDHVSRFVWHCHFLDHEDNDMMRPWHCVPR